MLVLVAIVAALGLAFANGANDNAKGVATLVAGRTLSLKTALRLAAASTFAGSIAAALFGQKLLAAFSGKGLVAGEILRAPAFFAAVGLAAATTVLLATRFGFPISTTHALVGGITGVGISAHALIWHRIVGTFLVPLVVGPLLSLVAAGALYVVLRRARLWMGVSRETCICVEQSQVPVPVTADGAIQAFRTNATVVSRPVSECVERYSGRVVGIEAQSLLDGAHVLSGGLISFARGLNDTPKIAAILLAVAAVHPNGVVTSVGVAIAVGGLVAVHRVAKVLSYRVAEMNDGQAFSANLVTAACVIFASRLGLPVSTTHVSCGSIFGIGAVNGKADVGVIGKIVAAWVVTLPLAAVLGWIFWRVFAA